MTDNLDGLASGLDIQCTVHRYSLIQTVKVWNRRIKSISMTLYIPFILNMAPLDI